MTTTLTALKITSFDWKQLPDHLEDYSIDLSGEYVLVPTSLLDGAVVSVSYHSGRADSVVVVLNNGKRIRNDDTSWISEEELKETKVSEDLEGWVTQT